MQPLVSIVIPTYNQVNFIVDTIESVLSQTYTHLEIFIADDCSKDGTVEVIRDYAAKDNRIKPLLSSKNLGISKNFNRAFDACTGKYVAFLGGDDIMFPEKISRQVDFLENHEDYVLVQHDMELYEDESGKSTLHSRSYHIPRHPLDWVLFSNWLFLKKPVGVLPSSCLSRREYYLKGRYDERFKYKHELLFTLDDYAHNPAGKWHVLPEVLGRYRIHSSNFSRQGANKALIQQETFMLYEEGMNRYPWLKKELENYRSYFLFISFLHNWFETGERGKYLRLFQQKSGYSKVFYLYLCKGLKKAGLLFPAAKVLKLIIPSRYIYRGG